MPEPLLDRAARTAGRVAAYAVVPLALSLLALDNVAQTAAARGFHVSVKFAMPADVATLWTLFDPPASGVHVVAPTSLSLLPVYLVVRAALAAGYLRGLADAARELQPSFSDAVAEHGVSMLGVQVAQFLVALVVALPLIAGGSVGLALLAMPVVLFVSYLLWGGPYLVVARDVDAVTALAWSASLATDGGRYFTFAVGYALVAAVASLFVSLVVTGAGLVGVVVAAAVVAYPSLVASAAATHVVDDVAAAEPTRGA
ncbi:hypothetical protein [Halobacterium yunchengense]|uniref:hypothetical protein n=1 Tax=Halobacterium yunchengense TaxID=3108497 RepID=UPI00300A9D09